MLFNMRVTFFPWWSRHILLSLLQGLKEVIALLTLVESRPSFTILTNYQEIKFVIKFYLSTYSTKNKSTHPKTSGPECLEGHGLFL